MKRTIPKSFWVALAMISIVAPTAARAECGIKLKQVVALTENTAQELGRIARDIDRRNDAVTALRWEFNREESALECGSKLRDGLLDVLDSSKESLVSPLQADSDRILTCAVDIRVRLDRAVEKARQEGKTTTISRLETIRRTLIRVTSDGLWTAQQTAQLAEKETRLRTEVEEMLDSCVVF